MRVRPNLPAIPALPNSKSCMCARAPPRSGVRWTKTAGSASDKFQDTPIFNETLRIANIQRVQGGRYYCKAENGVGVAAIKSIRVDVQSLKRRFAIGFALFQQSGYKRLTPVFCRRTDRHFQLTSKQMENGE
ncbi:hypothetical protein AOLI_G00016140 [Acnodon oligacanthus]